MITINLLPNERKRMTVGAPNVTLIYAVAGLLVVGAVGATYHFQHQLSARRATLERLEREQAALKDDVLDAEQKQEQLAVLKQRKEVITELFFSGPEVARKMNQISDLLPVGVWLEEVRINREQKQETVVTKVGDRTVSRPVRVEKQYFTVTGVTEDIVRGLSLAAETKTRLENSPFMESFLGEIDVKYQRAEPWLRNSQDDSGKRLVWRFELSMGVNADARKPKSSSSRPQPQPPVEEPRLVAKN